MAPKTGSEQRLELHIRLSYRVNAKGAIVVTEEDPINVVELVSPERTLRQELVRLAQAAGAPDTMLDSYSAYSLHFDDHTHTFKAQKVDMTMAAFRICSISKHILLRRKGG